MVLLFLLINNKFRRCVLSVKTEILSCQKACKLLFMYVLVHLYLQEVGRNAKRKWRIAESLQFFFVRDLKLESNKSNLIKLQEADTWLFS